MSDFEIERYKEELEKQKAMLSQKTSIRYVSLQELEETGEQPQPSGTRLKTGKKNIKTPGKAKQAKGGAQKKPNGKKRKKKKYKLLPLVVVGVGVAFLFALIAVLGYSVYCYASTRNGNVSVIAPTLIYMCSILLGSLFVSSIIRGYSMKPAFCIAGVFLAISLIYSFAVFGLEHIKWTTIPYKIVFSFGPAMFGFFLAWLLSLLHPKKKQVRHASRR